MGGEHTAIMDTVYHIKNPPRYPQCERTRGGCNVPRVRRGTRGHQAARPTTMALGRPSLSTPMATTRNQFGA